jgi:hypothetical protein
VTRTTRIGVVVAMAVAIALGATAAPALAGTFTLNLEPQSDAVVGRPLVIKTTGSVPPEDVGFPYWFSLDAIPASVTTTCPADQGEGAQFALGSGGAVVVLSQTQHPNLAGNFTIPVAVTPIAPGSLLLCGYTDDGGAVTLATTSLILDIKPAHRKGARKAKARCRRLHSRRARAHCLRRLRLRADSNR